MSDRTTDAEPAPRQVLRSPDGRAEMVFALDDWCADSRRVPGAPLWQVSFAGRTMLRHSILALTLGDPPTLLGGFTVAGVVRRRGNRSNDFREMLVRLRERAASARRLDLIFRCYDGAVAVRMRLPRQRGLRQVSEPEVDGTFRFPEDTQGWFEADGVFRSLPVDEAPRPLTQPLTLNYAHGKIACLIGCADPDSHISEYVRMATTPWESPWLVLLLADRPCDLPARSGVLLDLGARWPKPASVADAGDAVRNCMLPFVRHPLWQVSAEEPVATAPRGDGVPTTPAHRAAVAIMFDAGEPVWDETRFLRGEIGAYVVVARCRNRAWQVGGITGAEGRVLTVRLEDFLEKSEPRETYALEILRDPLPSETMADGLVCECVDVVDACDTPRLELPPGGGFVLCLTPHPRPSSVLRPLISDF